MKKLITILLLFITLTTFSQTVQKYKVTGIRSNITTSMKGVQSFEIAIIDSTFKIGEVSYTIKTIGDYGATYKIIDAFNEFNVLLYQEGTETVISIRMVTEFETIKVSYLCLKM